MSRRCKISNMNLDTISDRIKRRRKELKLTQKELATFIGISAASVTQWELGYTSPSGKNLWKLSEILKCEVDWLLYGKEKPQPESNAEWLGAIEPWDSETPLSPSEVEIPFFTEVALSAGNGAYAVRENDGPKLRFSKSSLRKANVHAANAVCVNVTGSSMEPAIYDGSTIGIDTASNVVKDGEMYAIDHDGMLRVKLLYRLPGNGLRLKSYNSIEYPDESYDAEGVKKIRIIGRVFWISSLLN